MGRAHHKKQFLLLIFISILILLLLDTAALIEYYKILLVSVDQRLAALIVVAIKVATVIVAPLSGSVLYGLVGMLFPFWRGVTYLTIGNALGISLAYWLGKRYGWQLIEYIGGKPWVQQGSELLDRMHDRKSFLIVRLSLFLVEDIVNFLGGMAKVGFVPFFLISITATTIFMLVVLLGIDGFLMFLSIY